MSERLTPTDWLDFGLTMLAEHGHGALKADVLATAKGVSRGSFYWHFKNLKDFHVRLLAHWRESTTRQVIVDIDALEDGQLAALMRRAFMNPPALERAIRAWSVGDEEASRVVAS
ncbi:MAG: TetR family transcriptional regulator, partial [Pseudomonadota bacterium]